MNWNINMWHEFLIQIEQLFHGDNKYNGEKLWAQLFKANDIVS